MKALFALSLFLATNLAYADKILNPGESYFCQYAGERVIADSGGSSQPPQQYDFVQQQRVDHDDAWQGHQEFNARAMCEGNGQAKVFFSSTVEKLLRDATNQCLHYYSSCQQLE